MWLGGCVFPALVDRVDRRLGDGVERLVRAHHRRRLARTGWADALSWSEALWADGAPPPRSGTRSRFSSMGHECYRGSRSALREATSHVHIAGWHVAPDFALTRGPSRDRLRELLAELAGRVDVRVLLWAGAPLPIFTPHRSQVRTIRDELVRGTRIRCALDSHERPMHCHHEKLVLIDDRIAFVGGVDLTNLGGDRYDSNEHPCQGAAWLA